VTSVIDTPEWEDEAEIGYWGDMYAAPIANFEVIKDGTP
jgi:hypothetical protein